MENYGYKEVWFNKYCDRCIYCSKKEDEEPCDECLSISVNLYSHKPVKFEENTKKTIKTEEAKG